MRILCLFFVPILGVLSCAQRSFGQVYNNVNAVGYLNVSLLPGFNLLSNPLLDRRGFTVADLVRSMNGNVPDGLSVYLLHPEGYHAATYAALSGTFEPADVAAEQLSPGLGFFVFNPSTNNLMFTFAGEIMQGTLTNSLPAGFSIVASMVPQNATLEVLGFPAEPGDIVYRFNPATQEYMISAFDDLETAWLPVAPRVNAGEAFFVFKKQPAVWTRTFLWNP